MAFRMEAAHFYWQRKNRVFPKTTPQWRRLCAQSTSNDSLLSFRSDDGFTHSLAHSVRELWPVITLKATIMAKNVLKR